MIGVGVGFCYIVGVNSEVLDYKLRKKNIKKVKKEGMGRGILLIQWYSYLFKGVEKGKIKNWFFKIRKILYRKKMINLI